MGIDSVHAPLLACALCGGTADDLFVVLGSSVGLTGMAVGFEMAFQKASRFFGWQLADEIHEDTPGSNPSDTSTDANDTASTHR